MEKIIVRAVKNPCAECKIKAKCPRKCMFFKMWKNGGISRKKAIDIMAKAMIRRFESEDSITDWEIRENRKNKYRFMYIDAEFALNALIKGVNK